MNDIYEKDQAILVLLVAVIVFLGLNFDPSLGQIYLGMLVLYYMILDDNPLISLGIFKQKNDYLMTLVWGLGAYAVFYIIASFTVGFFFPTNVSSVQSLTFNTLQAALTSSSAVRFIAFALLIPIIETIVLHGGLVQIYGRYLKADLNNLFDVKTIFSIIFVSATFSLFHLTAKGVTNSAALYISFVFALVSVVLILVRKQYSDAILLHIINNAAALGMFSAFTGA